MPDIRSTAEWVSNRASEPVLDIKNIQGNIMPGFNKDFQALLFLKIIDVQDFRHWLAALTPSITSMAEVLDFRRAFSKRRNQESSEDSPLKATWVNIAFSHTALEGLVPDFQDGDFRDVAFCQGLHQRSQGLGDPTKEEAAGNPTNWVVGGPNNKADVILIVASDTLIDLHKKIDDIETLIYTPRRRASEFHSSRVQVIFKQYGAVLTEPLAGHEHFGFRDGVSQPGIRGRIADNPNDFFTPQEGQDPDQGKPGQDLLWPGEFVFGRNYPRQDPHQEDVAALGSWNSLDHTPEDVRENTKAPPKPAIPQWAENGSFLVFRRLRQDVGTFHKFLRDKARELNVDVGLLGAKCVGRWASGAPILRAQALDNPRLAQEELENNDFEFQGDAEHREDPEGRVCPFAGHIRKTYTRDDENQDETVSESETQTHRLLRRGIPYGVASRSTAQIPTEDDEDRGLLFLAYQTSIENQFEVVQRRANDPNFKDADAGHDPVIGQNDGGKTRERQFWITFEGHAGKNQRQLVKTGEKDWVIPTGGGYFFAPSIAALGEFTNKN